MKQPSPSFHVLIAAFLAVASALITALISNKWDQFTLSSIATSTFLVALITPILLRLSQRPAQQKPEFSGETTTLYVGNIPFRSDEHSIQELFQSFGYVASVRLVKDRRTKRLKGYGFVEIDSQAADKAQSSLNNSEFQGRTIKVRAAHSEAED